MHLSSSMSCIHNIVQVLACIEIYYFRISQCFSKFHHRSWGEGFWSVQYRSSMRMRHESLYPRDREPFSYSFQGCKKLFKDDSNAWDAFTSCSWRFVFVDLYVEQWNSMRMTPLLLVHINYIITHANVLYIAFKISGRCGKQFVTHFVSKMNFCFVSERQFLFFFSHIRDLYYYFYCLIKKLFVICSAIIIWKLKWN